MVDAGQWEQKSFGAVAGLPAIAREQRKYVFLWDRQGSVQSYFQYRGSLCSLAPEIVKKSAGMQDVSAVLEKLRVHLVVAMRDGADTMIDLDKTSPNFLTEVTDESTFDARLVFNYEEWAKHENYIRFVKEEETVSKGGLNPGHYSRDPNFCLLIRSSADNAEELALQTANIPGFEDMIKVVVQ